MEKQEEESFLGLITENRGIIYKICNSYCDNKTDREDLAQEIIYTLWKGRRTYDPAFKYTTWMYRVALNVAISFCRASSLYKKRLLLSGQERLINENTFVKVDTDDNLSLLQRHVAALHEMDKALIILYFEGNNYREISEVLGITETNVATRLSRIKERLKQKITSSKKDNDGRQ
jgi:RNA polymerase sigma factor (sigma-70 family)